MTPAGATFPYGKDPNDSNIRIAPTYPPVEELLTAMELLCVCVKIAVIEKLLNS
jgi:DNA-binding transcriptional MocR family regulator